MEPVFIRELDRYSKSDILKILGNNSAIFNKLRKHSIIRIDKDKNYYFRFVGVIAIEDFIFNFYPKYITTEDDEEKRKDFKDVIKIFRKINKSDEEFSYENDEEEDSSLNLLPLMLFFIEDYYENGLYSNIQNVLEINGNGEINWDRTINDSFPLIKNNKPYYLEIHTRRKIDDLYNYFRLLHKVIITECSQHLEDGHLLYYFDLTPVKLTDRTLDDFGDNEYILHRLEKQLNIEFNTQKQKLLRLMHSYISNRDSFANDDFFTFYGTPKYETVWENICGEVLQNVFNKPLVDLKSEGFLKELNLHELIIDLNLEEQLKGTKLEEITLKHLIEKPNWVSTEGFSKEADTYIPDIITISNDNFIVLDAKYYDLTFTNEELKGQPGIESISKQYFYDLSFRKFIKLVGFKGVRNAFLFPNYDSEIENSGYVELEMFSNLGLENIQIIMIPAKRIHQKYLTNDTMEISELCLDKYYCPKCGSFNKDGKYWVNCENG